MPLDIVGLGLATLDILIRLGDLPTWEHGAGCSAVGLDGGGPVGTACVAAARLGARVGYIGTAGNDQLATLKVQSLQEDGVDLSRLGMCAVQVEVTGICDIRLVQLGHLQRLISKAVQP